MSGQIIIQLSKDHTLTNTIKGDTTTCAAMMLKVYHNNPDFKKAIDLLIKTIS